MIKINDILNAKTNSVNASLKEHYFKDITTYGVCELKKSNGDEDSIPKPHVYTGNGEWTFIQDDTKSLIIYHRIIKLDNDEDFDAGWGRNPLFSESYEIKSVFYGQQLAIEDDDCEDINLTLAQEFKKLIPRTLTLVDTNSIKVTSIETVKDTVADDEGLVIAPSSVCFSLTLNIEIKSTENCTTLNC